VKRHDSAPLLQSAPASIRKRHAAARQMREMIGRSGPYHGLGRARTNQRETLGFSSRGTAAGFFEAVEYAVNWDYPQNRGGTGAVAQGAFGSIQLNF
jgi:hypothetical protein